jgi:hypothetical protein
MFRTLSKLFTQSNTIPLSPYATDVAVKKQNHAAKLGVLRNCSWASKVTTNLR